MAEVPERPDTDDRQQKILDAVNEIVAERGIGGLTTAIVARRARVAPGKFYELYADKYDVLQAATDRNLMRFLDRLGDELDGRTGLDLAELGRVTLAVWIDLCREDPGFRVLRFWRAPELTSGDGGDEDARLVQVWAEFLGHRYGIDDTSELRRTMTLAVKLVGDAVEYAFALEPHKGDAEVLEQVHRVLEFHLTSAREAAPGGSEGS